MIIFRLVVIIYNISLRGASMFINHLYKRLFIVISLFTAISLSPIQKSDYAKLTDRDRILLAISYYEVSIKYKNLKKDELAKSYLNEAQKIEADVEKYAKGELSIPPKTINIDWNSIFKEEASEDVSSDDSKKNESNDVSSKNDEGVKKKLNRLALLLLIM